MRHKLLLAYNGTDYSGWQIQETTPQPPTIQGEIEKALKKITAEKIRVIGSGRTDAGVHAHGQVAHFDSDSANLQKLPDLQHTLNALLPKDIRVLEATHASENFHAQHDVKSKSYVYQLWTEQRFMPPFLQNFAWQCGKLDEEILSAACALFSGTMDFASFQNSGSDCRSSIRHISAITIQTLDSMPFFPNHAPFLQISVTANGFLKQMVRNIVGFVVAAAQNRITLDSFKDIMAAANRKFLPTRTAPACGLFLAKVDYGLSG